MLNSHSLRQRRANRDRHRQLRQRQRQHAGAHGGGEPVRGELADHFTRMLKLAERLDTGFDVLGQIIMNSCPLVRLSPW
jgi:hypothetical protein